MNRLVIDTDPGVDEATLSAGPYTVYVASGLFNQYDLAMNILIKEAVWRLSGGRFELYLPQSKELRDLDRPDIEAYIRNVDLLAVLQADIVLARFDGLELDSGVLVEYMMAKSLGKPTVIVRSDSRGLSGAGLDAPYNLMVKSWARNVDVHVNALILYQSLLVREREAYGGSGAFQAAMQAEFGTVQESIDAVAQELIDGMEAVLKLESPYPPEYQEVVYKACRYSPGSGFDQILTENELGEIIQRLRRNGTLCLAAVLWSAILTVSTQGPCEL